MAQPPPTIHTLELTADGACALHKALLTAAENARELRKQVLDSIAEPCATLRQQREIDAYSLDVDTAQELAKQVRLQLGLAEARP
jgi:hypothetical protein